MLTYDALYDAIHEGVFYDHVRQKVAASKGLQIFGVKLDKRKEVRTRNAHTPTGFGFVGRGQDYPLMSNATGDSLTVTQKHYAGRLVIAKEDRIFAMQGPSGEMDLTDIEGLVRGAVDQPMDDFDQALADSLLYGFSDSYTDAFGQTESSLTPDGVRLFSAAHTLPGSITFSNLITLASSATVNAPLSSESLRDAIIAGRTFRGAGNILRPVELDTLIVSPKLADKADQIVNSDKYPFDANNAKNFGSVRGLKIVVWDRLAATGQGTDTSDYYFLADSKKLKEYGIKVHTAQMLQLGKSKESTDSENWTYPLDLFYTIARNEPQFIFGSNGTSA